jgi:hypothetical protein
VGDSEQDMRMLRNVAHEVKHNKDYSGFSGFGAPRPSDSDDTDASEAGYLGGGSDGSPYSSFFANSHPQTAQQSPPANFFTGNVSVVSIADTDATSVVSTPKKFAGNPYFTDTGASTPELHPYDAFDQSSPGRFYSETFSSGHNSPSYGGFGGVNVVKMDAFSGSMTPKSAKYDVYKQESEGFRVFCMCVGLAAKSVLTVESAAHACVFSLVLFASLAPTCRLLHIALLKTVISCCLFFGMFTYELSSLVWKALTTPNGLNDLWEQDNASFEVDSDFGFDLGYESDDSFNGGVEGSNGNANPFLTGTSQLQPKNLGFFAEKNSRSCSPSKEMQEDFYFANVDNGAYGFGLNSHYKGLQYGMSKSGNSVLNKLGDLLCTPAAVLSVAYAMTLFLYSITLFDGIVKTELVIATTAGETHPRSNYGWRPLLMCFLVHQAFVAFSAVLTALAGLVVQKGGSKGRVSFLFSSGLYAALCFGYFVRSYWHIFLQLPTQLLFTFLYSTGVLFFFMFTMQLFCIYGLGAVALGAITGGLERVVEKKHV